MLSKEIFIKIQELLPITPLIIGELSLAKDIDELVASAFPEFTSNNKILLVGDNNTNIAFGDLIHKALKSRFRISQVNFGKVASANQEAIDYLCNEGKLCDAIIAVGSGTINDLCKYASFLLKIPYIVFPTAASMNGYLSASASITTHGHKTSFSAHLPRAVFCDFSVIAKAPLRLSQAGLGDSLARPTAQADWLLSNLLLGTDYNKEIFALTKNIEEELFESAAGIVSGDMATIKLLMQNLLLSGLGMTIAGGSYPASEAEHMIAHTYSMLKPKIDSDILHGEEIAVTSLYIAKMQHDLLNKAVKIRNANFDQQKMANFFGKELADEFVVEFTEKYKKIGGLSGKIGNWDAVAHELEKIILPLAQMNKIANAAKLPTKYEDLNWEKNRFYNALETARFTRNRFTFLDITD